MAMHSTYADNIMATFTLVDTLFFIRLTFVNACFRQSKGYIYCYRLFLSTLFLARRKKRILKKYFKQPYAVIK